MKSNSYLITLLSTLTVITVATSLYSVNAQENTTDSTEPKFFAIQHANSGTISKINDATYSLELNDVSKKTILFSDRPDRIVKSISTSDFIGNWTVGEDSFAVDAPNAVLVVDEQEVAQYMAIIELFNPVYNLDNQSLKYYVTPDNATAIDLPDEFGRTTLVIDAHKTSVNSQVTD